MQRRAAAVYFAVFVLLGAGAYGFIQVGTSHPSIDLPGETYAAEDTLTVGDQEFTVGEIAYSNGGGGHGGGGGSIESALTWTNESAVATATVENGSDIAYGDGQYTVQVESGDSPSSFELVESFNVTAILSADDAVEDDPVEREGTQYVVFTENQSIRPLEEYLPEPEVAGPFSAGDTLEYQPEGENGTVSATVDAVTGEGVTFSWTSPADREVSLSEGGNVTLSGQQYFVHFPDAESVQILPTDQHYDTYQEELAYEDAWFTRHAGLWAVVIVSFMGAIILLGAAYMPVKE